MITCIFVFMLLAPQYSLCLMEDQAEYENPTSPIIDLDGLQQVENAEDNYTETTSEGFKLIGLFLDAYCATNNEFSFCTTYNRCKNKTECNINKFLNTNTDFISTLMSKIINIDDTHKLVELPDSWIKYVLIVVIVVLKVIISYLLERQFNLCGKLKTKIEDKKRKSEYVRGNETSENDGEELKVMVFNPPEPLPVHAQPTTTTSAKHHVYDVPKTPTTSIATIPQASSPPDKPPRVS